MCHRRGRWAPPSRDTRKKHSSTNHKNTNEDEALQKGKDSHPQATALPGGRKPHPWPPQRSHEPHVTRRTSAHPSRHEDKETLPTAPGGTPRGEQATSMAAICTPRNRRPAQSQPVKRQEKSWPTASPGTSPTNTTPGSSRPPASTTQNCPHAKPVGEARSAAAASDLQQWRRDGAAPN